MARIDMPAAAGDFRLIDRQALEANQLDAREQSVRARHVRVDRLSARSVSPIQAPRDTAFRRSLCASFLKLGFAASGLAFIFGLVTIATKIAGVFNVPGYVTIVFAVTFIGGVQLIVLGVIGEYLARVFEEVKGRPLYFVAASEGIAVRSHGRRDQVPAAVRESLDPSRALRSEWNVWGAPVGALGRGGSCSQALRAVRVTTLRRRASLQPLW
jgi:polyisoprenyl-phosphate glycosyltransferase